MSEVEEGIARLESTLAGTRVNAERALRELHQAMSRDLARLERRAARAERKVEELRAGDVGFNEDVELLRRMIEG